MLRTEHCTVTRQGRAILSALSVSFQPGKVTALIGPNGAGKSTLLKLISGEIHPDSGSVFLNDRPLPDWPTESLARFRAVLPQESALSFPFTVEEVVSLGRIPHRASIDHAEDAHIIRESLSQVDMLGKASQLYPTLSGGEKQRVQLARILAQLASPPPDSAPIMLLDEPVAALDPSHRFATLRLAREKAAHGAAVVVVLHDVNLVSAFADHLIALKEGALIASGPVESTLTTQLVKTLFDVDAISVTLPTTGKSSILLIPSEPQQ